MRVNGPPTSGMDVATGTETAPGRRSNEDLTAKLRGFGPLGILAIVVILSGSLLTPLLGTVLVLLWVWWSDTAWREIGYVRPNSWIGDLAVGIAFGSSFKFLLKAIVMPLLGAPTINQPYHYLAGNRAAIPSTLFMLIVGTGFGEETFFRGYLFERLGKLLGSGTIAKSAIVLITSSLFAIAHYSVQGLPGTEQATITGLAFGTIFAFTGQIWMLMCAHAAFDLAAYAIIYWNLETRVAHLIFR